MPVHLENVAINGMETKSDELVRKYSMATLDQYSPLMDEHRRKISLQGMVEATASGLSNTFALNEQSPEILIYNMFKIPNKPHASIGKLIMVLKNYGLQETDPRLAPMMKRIWSIEKEKEERSCEARDPKHWKLAREDFIKCINESISLISKTLQNELIIPSWGTFTRIIRDIYEEVRNLDAGKVADYIPQLGRVNPKLFGLAITTIDGQRCSFGDAKTVFCLQSVSKAFNYAIASSELGSDYVHQFVGQEPSGRLFNEICLDANRRPNNPLINSGAIVTCSLIQSQKTLADRFDHMLAQYRRLAGNEYVGFNNGVFLSERSTADRNKALAYYMRENDCFPKDCTNLMETLDFYFQLCSLELTCESASVLAATLAFGGVCPITGERVLDSKPCRDVLSLMSSCGMYDESGQWAFHIGLPAKSGVSGILMVVVPNVLGLALYSPPLNKQGNSVRSIAFCHKLIKRFNFHSFDVLSNNESNKIDPRKRSYNGTQKQIVDLLFAAKAGDLNTIRRLYLQGADLELADYDKRTALHLAASEGHPDVLRFLINTAKVKLDPRDRWQRTPLHDARSERHFECIRLLEKAATIAEERWEEDSGIVLPILDKTRTRSVKSQCSSSDSSDDENEGDDSDNCCSSTDSNEQGKVTERRVFTNTRPPYRPKRTVFPFQTPTYVTIVFLSLLFMLLITGIQ
ncbi:No extended memory [Aphelenchoides besseyi]|nr:No extended memory [Aphelenchoides besseyi]